MTKETLRTSLFSGDSRIDSMADVHFASANMQKAQTGSSGKGFCFI